MTPSEELEKKAIELGEDRKKLIKRLYEAMSCLSEPVLKHFRWSVRFDFKQKRMLSKDGVYALQWKIRRHPNEPDSYDNQQTSQGYVALVELERDQHGIENSQ